MKLSKHHIKTVKISSLVILLAIILSACSFGANIVSEEITNLSEYEIVEVPNGNDSENEGDQTEASGIIEFNHAALFSPVWETREILHENFVDQPVDDQVLVEGAIEGLQSYLEHTNASIDGIEIPEGAYTAEEIAERANTPDDVFDTYLPFFELWQVAEYAVVENDLDAEDMMQWALGYLVSSLGDAHTSYLNPEMHRQTQVQLTGSYEGIGAWVDPNAEYLTIISPIEGSPAEAVGLQPGDQILAIDGEDMTGIDGNVVIQSVLGPAGSDVVLTIGREGMEPFDVTITRATIVIPNVRSEILEGNIAHVELLTFGTSSANDLYDTLEEVLAENPAGLILDLRGNGGGWLNVAVDIVSMFVEEDVALYEQFGDGYTQTYYTNENLMIATDIPLIVLVDGGSASASEILAGAIQDYGRGILVGTTTFGKGSVQFPIILENDQGSVRVTVARWLTPDERHIHGVGLEPDYFVEYTQEDFDAGLDPQLDFAVELMLEGVAIP